ncbi:MAG TPA: low affinity iron permease family protein [Acidimicrobiia bacterium]|nr:low affinity iron permease family protein [Acidimicrobiia bacterium]
MFEHFASWVCRVTGRPLAFTMSVAMVVAWALTGPVFDYDDTWQLIINTATTVITFWMVFVLQHSQNKDTKAIELKLDELLRKVSGADDRLVGIEAATEDTLDRLKGAERAAVGR